MNLQFVHTLGRVFAGAVLSIGLIAGLIGITPLPADAAINSGVEALRSATSCDTGTRTAYMNSSIMLNQARFPNGAWVSNSYVYFGVDAYGNQTTPLYRTAWTSSRLIDTSQATRDAGGSPMIVESYATLGSFTLRATGRIHVLPEVAIWNGSSWEFTWVRPSTYSNNFGTGTLSQNSFCALSW